MNGVLVLNTDLYLPCNEWKRTSLALFYNTVYQKKIYDVKC